MRSYSFIFLSTVIMAVPHGLQAYGPDDFLAWVEANQSAEPQFVDGDVITFDKADLVRPFIPTEFQDEWIFDGMEMAIKDAGDLTPAQIYLDATEKIQRDRHAR